MPITNTWLIEQMDCYPTADGQTDVVFTLHWRINAADGTYAATAYGTVGVANVAGSPYTPFAQLTQAQVVGWVKGALGEDQVTQLEASLATNIANQANPPVISPKLPWAAA
jgi:hypothetical protein